MAIGFQVGHERLAATKAHSVAIDIARAGQDAIDRGRRHPDRLGMIRVIVRFHFDNFGKRTDDERAEICCSLLVIDTHPAHPWLGSGVNLNLEFPLFSVGLDRKTITFNPAVHRPMIERP